MTTIPKLLLQFRKKNENSVPDATITQNSFKIVVETKRSDWFYEDQLIRHLNSFSDEKYKVIVTLAPELMNNETKTRFDNYLKENYKDSILHFNTTFDKLADAVEDVLEDNDYEMLNILDDYRSYLYDDGLSSKTDSWKFMKAQTVGNTFELNLEENIYYQPINKSFRHYDYLGLYKDKNIKAIGKVSAIITSVKTENGTEYKAEFGELTEDHKNTIERTIEKARKYGHDLTISNNRFFFVEKFYDTDFRKISSGPLRGYKKFDLTEIIGSGNVLNAEKLVDTEKIAEILKTKTWI